MQLLLFVVFLFFNLVNSQSDTSCGGWCKNVAESSSCSGCEDTDNCVSIPVSECEAGYWPLSNSQMDGPWFVSRSTHYGGTSGGACGYGNVPNCYGTSCEGVPTDITNSPFAGLYAAPQGDYYAQLDDFLSCGSCFEIYCVDPTCTTNSSIYINLCDSCPCHPNIKWCCNNWSHCDELRGDNLNNQPHCFVSENGIWSNYSLHLDLSDMAFGMLTIGDRNKTPPSGVVNTMMRRVSCPVTGNAYIIFNTASVYSKTCYVGNNNINGGYNTSGCFYYLAMNPYNLGGYGTVKNLTLFAGLVNNNNQLIYKNFSLIRNPNYPVNKTQEQFGNWVNPQNLAIYMPMQIFIHDGGGRVIGSKLIQNFDDGYPEYFDMGINFQKIDINELNSKLFYGH